VTEQKRPRPSWIETVQLPGHEPSRGEPKPELLVEDVRQGARTGVFEAGALLPEVPHLQKMYVLSQNGIQEAMSCLRREGVANLHDEYLETYFIEHDYVYNVGQKSR
jgi:DNA-binding transcriptional MocR family regulator